MWKFRNSVSGKTKILKFCLSKVLKKLSRNNLNTEPPIPRGRAVARPRPTHTLRRQPKNRFGRGGQASRKMFAHPALPRPSHHTSRPTQNSRRTNPLGMGPPPHHPAKGGGGNSAAARNSGMTPSETIFRSAPKRRRCCYPALSSVVHRESCVGRENVRSDGRGRMRRASVLRDASLPHPKRSFG